MPKIQKIWTNKMEKLLLPSVLLSLLLWKNHHWASAFVSSSILLPSKSNLFELTPVLRRQRAAKDTSNTEATSSASSTNPTMPTPMWFQHAITVTAPSRGCHLVTGDILKAVGDDLKQIQLGMCNLFIQHTSASLTINENADPDVRTDMETALNKLVPATWNRDGTFKHTLEGDDDMPGHVKSSLMGVSLNVPIRDGRLALGTWQGIYLNEHRDQGGWGGGHQRSIIITLQGVASR